MPENSPYSALAQLIAQRPTEPFTDKTVHKRRPNGYRDTPEYRDWTAADRSHCQAVQAWFDEGLDVLSNERNAAITLYGDIVAGAHFHQRADGAFDWQGLPQRCGFTPPYPNWAPSVPLPTPKADLAVFLANIKSHHWNPLQQIKNHVGPILPSGQYTINVPDGIILQWAGALRRLLDPAVIRLLRQICGPRLQPTLRLYNAAVIGQDALRSLRITNPGAAAWYLYRLNSQHSGEPNLPICRDAAPIIAAVKADFQEKTNHHGDWKHFTAQPGPDIVAQLADGGNLACGASRVGAISRLLADAQLPRQRPEPAPAAAPPPAPEPPPLTPLNSQPALLNELTPAVPEPPPEPPEPSPSPVPAGYVQPPAALKAAAYELASNGPTTVTMPGNPEGIAAIHAAYRHTAVLALRHYAGADGIALARTVAALARRDPRRRNPPPPNQVRYFTDLLQNTRDYCRRHPEMAVRATKWSGLQKRVQRYHRADNLAREVEARRRDAEAQELADAYRQAYDARRAALYDQEWYAHLHSYATEEFTARLLRTPRELGDESLLMTHCIGNGGYDDGCHRGTERIWHIEPQGLQPGDTAAVHREATTLQIIQRAGPNHWTIAQHRGYENRAATDMESRWAKELVNHWNRTYTPEPADAPATDSAQPA